jgi:hypothetical protein
MPFFNMLKQPVQQLKSILRGPKYQVLSWWEYILPSINRWNSIHKTDDFSEKLNANLVVYRSFWAASRYTPWSAWSLHPLGCLLVADLLMSEEIQKIVEFGAGYSTIFLTKFIQQTSTDTTIESFEHQEEFSGRLAMTLNDIDNHVATLHTCELIQCTDEQFKQLFRTDVEPQTLLKQKGVAAPIAEYRGTRLRNAFYDYDFSVMPDHSIDLIILGGPNSNGRSIAFPLLKNKMKTPSWLLMDDYLDHPFLADLQSVFQSEIVAKEEIDDNEYVLLKLHHPHESSRSGRGMR